MDRTRTPRAGCPLLLAALLFSTSAPATPSAASFSLKDGAAQMASFRDGIFTVRARPRFERPDGYVALAFGSASVARSYFLIVTQTGMKLWKIDDGARKLLDIEPIALAPGQEIRLKFSIRGRRYYAEIAGYPPIIADDEASFKGRLVLRAAGARVDYDDPVVELERPL